MRRHFPAECDLRDLQQQLRQATRGRRDAATADLGRQIQDASSQGEGATRRLHSRTPFVYVDSRVPDRLTLPPLLLLLRSHRRLSSPLILAVPTERLLFWNVLPRNSTKWRVISLRPAKLAGLGMSVRVCVCRSQECDKGCESLAACLDA